MGQHISPPTGFKPRNSTQVTSLIVGALLFTLGASGLLFSGFAGLHLGLLHSLILIIAGTTLFYNGGWKENSFYAYLGCFFFGLFFALLAFSGLIFGEPGIPSIGARVTDPNHFVLIRGIAEYGKLDHILNAIISAILLGGALDWHRRIRGEKVSKKVRQKVTRRKTREHYKIARLS